MQACTHAPCPAQHGAASTCHMGDKRVRTVCSSHAWPLAACSSLLAPRRQRHAGGRSSHAALKVAEAGSVSGWQRSVCQNQAFATHPCKSLHADLSSPLNTRHTSQAPPGAGQHAPPAAPHPAAPHPAAHWSAPVRPPRSVHTHILHAESPMLQQVLALALVVTAAMCAHGHQLSWHVKQRSLMAWGWRAKQARVRTSFSAASSPRRCSSCASTRPRCEAAASDAVLAARSLAARARCSAACAAPSAEPWRLAPCMTLEGGGWQTGEAL